MAGKRCGDPAGLIQIFTITSGVVNLVNDLYLLILPLPAIAKLRLDRKKKLGVLFIFLVGAAACIMSILGLMFRKRGYSRDRGSMWARDTTYLQINLFVVMIVEYSVGVIIPCMAPVVKFSKHVSVNMRSYLSSRSFQRTSSLGEEYRLDNTEKKNLDPKMDTIDRMLAQMFPGDSENTDTERTAVQH
ncbi:hypothetical protein DM02DRAFT_532845 [Periconia macrospinosa]|uniref:Rhodopsin domain-containing protein n=1 Tax=Periconia macrospinosa TaxID=97972 RepID=A0A2V1DKG8_9PLEO|nr:hypothetical protein DM02DRAFT_532845 [Periconia macrospinosa]